MYNKIYKYLEIVILMQFYQIFMSSNYLFTNKGKFTYNKDVDF